mmetsp:Transcript_99739/g.280429  ORF Transcript_99739/g.280429 Transcript_99739/m.280429 type:complete len:257 (-) Transcript_99739:116-886(-)
MDPVVVRVVQISTFDSPEELQHAVIRSSAEQVQRSTAPNRHKYLRQGMLASALDVECVEALPGVEVHLDLLMERLLRTQATGAPSPLLDDSGLHLHLAYHLAQALEALLLATCEHAQPHVGLVPVPTASLLQAVSAQPLLQPPHGRIGLVQAIFVRVWVSGQGMVAGHGEGDQLLEILDHAIELFLADIGLGHALSPTPAARFRRAAGRRRRAARRLAARLLEKRGTDTLRFQKHAFCRKAFLNLRLDDVVAISEM